MQGACKCLGSYHHEILAALTAERLWPLDVSVSMPIARAAREDQKL
jgi:hypothetical protein